MKENWQRYKDEANHLLVSDRERRTVAIIALGWEGYRDVIFDNIMRLAEKFGWKIVVRDIFRRVLCEIDYTGGAGGN